MSERKGKQQMPPTTPPAYLAHWVVKTARAREMIEWYGHVFGAHVVHEDDQIAFLTWDEESHRLALIKLPRLLRLAFPLAKFRRKAYGLDHIAFGVASLADLLTMWEQLRDNGIEPVWAINHGPTTSLYYEDPDGFRLEFQVENFATAQETADFLGTQQFADNPIGVNVDPGYLLEQLRDGVHESELLRRGAGTRPGTRQKANRETINFRTL
ncbi:catechol 2,3-dioxygenase-like lactoylglutathione lyase family enzyme [Nocardia kruczakiae]|uniref:Catechol 2,3-dioxygenase-like lactoylglutathione lyase family enzyme n=1 Tax=Nocardia kruczakiae TaxID=261477 RepID=A0ABU1XRH5_9NOCA|nr:VOC family protein [Nocardia kruczakiae]MDR7172984.1 catechol 2,3-dioxygenase-like lactoylglutathione lyase family enzyme [Nocardia kruczakiae]